MNVQTVMAVITSVVVVMMVGGAFVDSTHTQKTSIVERGTWSSHGLLC